MNENQLEDYLREIYKEREGDRKVEMYFLYCNGVSLGAELLNGLIEKLKNSLVSKDTFIINGRGENKYKVFVVDLPEINE